VSALGFEPSSLERFKRFDRSTAALHLWLN